MLEELAISAIETPGGNRILVKNIIAQQIVTRKRGIFKKHLVYYKKYLLSNVSSHYKRRLNIVKLFHLFYDKF